MLPSYLYYDYYNVDVIHFILYTYCRFCRSFSDRLLFITTKNEEKNNNKKSTLMRYYYSYTGCVRVRVKRREKYDVHVGHVILYYISIRYTKRILYTRVRGNKSVEKRWGRHELKVHSRNLGFFYTCYNTFIYIDKETFGSDKKSKSWAIFLKAYSCEVELILPRLRATLHTVIYFKTQYHIIYNIIL